MSPEITFAPHAVFAATINVGVPSIDLPATLSRLLALVPLVGGYLLAREGRGNLLWEILAVVLLVLATVIPITGVSLTSDSLNTIGTAFVNRLPVALLLLGLAFVRDGGAKMIIGLVLIVVSGLILLPIRG